ncbi:MAG: cytochrome b [Candidatus Competibacteraceae bacterium]|nr:cytochrome b [Candidatus Competibacteraceae bacterium]
MTQTPRYTLTQRLLHWLIAFLALLTLGIGMILGSLGFEGTQEIFGKATTNAFYTGHKTGGVLILIFMFLRLGVRLVSGAPPYPSPLNAFERVASRTVHGLLYVALLTMPILGWLATAAGGYPVQFFAWNLPGMIGQDKALSEILFSLHGIVGWVSVGLLILHIGGALQHWLIKRDAVMTRMSLFR